MPRIFSSIEQNWRVLAGSPAGGRLLRRWQSTEPDLRSVHSAGDLLAAARDIDGVDLDARDGLQLALLRIAETDTDARLAVVALLRPALNNLARAYADTWDEDEAASRVLTAALGRIVAYPHHRPRPAATIIRHTHHHLSKQARRERSRRPALPDTSLDLLLDQPAVNQRTASEELLELIDDAIRAGALNEDRARLVTLHRVCGVPTAALALTEGYPEATIRQRRNRAEAALASFAVVA